MNIFIWRKNNVLFSRYLDFCVFEKSIDFKICDVTIDIATQWKLHLRLFLLNPKYYQNEIWSVICCITNISNMFGSMLETGNFYETPGPFMVLFK